MIPTLFTTWNMATRKAAASLGPELLAVAGTYEGGLVGWGLSSSGEDGSGSSWARLGPPTLSFSFGAHIGAVKAVAIDESGETLATGGVDEYIKLYNLRTRKERGELTMHKGSVTALAFYKNSHLLSASSDGTVCIWRTTDWVCLHVLGGHKAAVTTLAIHPSGRMAMSGSRDRTLRLWNLVEGRCGYITKPTFPKSAEIEKIDWSPSGSAYAVVAAGTLQIFNATQAGKPVPFTSHVQQRRINAVKFLGDDSIVIAGDDCCLQVLSVASGEVLRRVDGAANARIKDLSIVQSSQGPPLVVSVTSAGDIGCWDLVTPGDNCCVSSANASSRITCIAVARSTSAVDDSSTAIAGKKRVPEAPEVTLVPVAPSETNADESGTARPKSKKTKQKAPGK